MAPDSSKTEGLCHMCGEFKPYQNHKGSGKGPTPWFRRESRYLSIFSHCPVRLSSISTPSRCSRVPSILLSQKRGEEEHETCSKPQLIKKASISIFRKLITQTNHQRHLPTDNLSALHPLPFSVRSFPVSSLKHTQLLCPSSRRFLFNPLQPYHNPISLLSLNLFTYLCPSVPLSSPSNSPLLLNLNLSSPLLLIALSPLSFPLPSPFTPS